MRSQHACARIGTLLLGAVLMTPLAAQAGEDCLQTHRVECLPRLLFHTDPIFHSQPRPAPAKHVAKPAAKAVESHVLLSLNRVPPAPPRVRSEIIFSLKRGVEYRSHFALDGRRLSLSFWGPVVKKKPGFGMELKGLELGSHEVKVEAYGNTGQGRVRVKLAF